MSKALPEGKTFSFGSIINKLMNLSYRLLIGVVNTSLRVMLEELDLISMKILCQQMEQMSK